MKLDEIFNQWEQDSQINQSQLNNVSAETPKLHHKYYKMFSAERLNLRKLETDYKSLFLLKYEYYMGTLDYETLVERNWPPNPKKILRTDISMYIDADADIVNLTLKIALQKEKIQLLESIIDSLQKRGFIVKNIIDWNRFQQGG